MKWHKEDNVPIIKLSVFIGILILMGIYNTPLSNLVGVIPVGLFTLLTFMVLQARYFPIPAPSY